MEPTDTSMVNVTSETALKAFGAAKANPAMDAVPMVDTRLCTIILPSWNMPFSIPLGIPMCKISLITSGLKPSLKCLSTCI